MQSGIGVGPSYVGRTKFFLKASPEGFFFIEIKLSLGGCSLQAGGTTGGPNSKASKGGPPTTAKTDKLPKSNFLHAAQPIKTSIDISSQRSSFFPSVFYLPSHDLLQKNYIHFKYLYVH